MVFVLVLVDVFLGDSAVHRSIVMVHRAMECVDMCGIPGHVRFARLIHRLVTSRMLVEIVGVAIAIHFRGRVVLVTIRVLTPLRHEGTATARGPQALLDLGGEVVDTILHVDESLQKLLRPFRRLLVRTKLGPGFGASASQRSSKVE